jgi:hypothetical protein
MLPWPNTIPIAISVLKNPMKKRKQPEPIWIGKRQDLCHIAAPLEKEPAIGVDLESDSLFHSRKGLPTTNLHTFSKHPH